MCLFPISFFVGKKLQRIYFLSQQAIYPLGANPTTEQPPLFCSSSIVLYPNLCAKAHVPLNYIWMCIILTFYISKDRLRNFV